MKQLRVLADLRECKEGFSGISVDTCRIFKSLVQLEAVSEVGGLLTDQQAKTFTCSLAKTVDGSDSYIRQARYLNALLQYPNDDLKSKILNYLSKIKNGLSLRWFLQTTFDVRPIDRFSYADFIWQTFFSKTMPVEDYHYFMEGSFFGTQLCFPLTQFRTRPYLPSPTLNTKGWDIFFTSTPLNVNVSKGTKKVVRYHDAISIFYPHLTPNSPSAEYKQLKSCALDTNTHFVCNSQHTRDELLAMFPAVEKRSAVIPCAVSDGFFRSKERPQFQEIISSHISFDSIGDGNESLVEKAVQQFSGRYIICVSSVEPRKNYSALIRAWAEVHNTYAPELNLIIVGRNGWQCQPIFDLMKPHVAEGSLIHLKSIPFSALRMLLSYAQAYVFPTLAEGFGMGAIEAMRCGCPTIVSDIKVTRETCGEASLFVNPYDIEALSKAIIQLISDEPSTDALRRRLIEKGYNHSGQFTIERCRQQWENFLPSLVS